MKKTTSNAINILTALLFAVAVATFVSCSNGKVEKLQAELKKFTDERAMVENNMVTFDTLDYTVFSNQEWTRLHESHSKDV